MILLTKRTRSVSKPCVCTFGVSRLNVNASQTEAELAAIRHSIQRGSPLGDETWIERTARRVGLESTLRPRGRPKKSENGS